MRKALRRMIVRAAPTCTLWTPMFQQDALRFRPWPAWTISAQEYVTLSKG